MKKTLLVLLLVSSNAFSGTTTYYTCGSYITCQPSVNNQPSVCKMYDGASYLFISDSKKYYTTQTTLFLGQVRDHTLVINNAKTGIADCYYYKDAYNPDSDYYDFVSDLNHHSVFPLFDGDSVWTLNTQTNEYYCNPIQSQCHLNVIY